MPFRSHRWQRFSWRGKTKTTTELKDLARSWVEKMAQKKIVVRSSVYSQVGMWGELAIFGVVLGLSVGVGFGPGPGFDVAADFGDVPRIVPRIWC